MGSRCCRGCSPPHVHLGSRGGATRRGGGRGRHLPDPDGRAGPRCSYWRAFTNRAVMGRGATEGDVHGPWSNDTSDAPPLRRAALAVGATRIITAPEGHPVTLYKTSAVAIRAFPPAAARGTLGGFRASCARRRTDVAAVVRGRGPPSEPNTGEDRFVPRDARQGGAAADPRRELVSRPIDEAKGGAGPRTYVHRGHRRREQSRRRTKGGAATTLLIATRPWEDEMRARAQVQSQFATRFVAVVPPGRQSFSTLRRRDGQGLVTLHQRLGEEEKVGGGLQ